MKAAGGGGEHRVKSEDGFEQRGMQGGCGARRARKEQPSIKSKDR